MPEYAHLEALSDDIGVFEHALYAVPRPEHGYCVDDVARGLLVTSREPDQTPELGILTETYLRFVERALDSDGRSHNRMSATGDWTDTPSVGDWWGRAVWALGFAAVHAPLPLTRRRALRSFARAAQQTSPYLRASAFAALGACEVLSDDPGDNGARRLVSRAVGMMPAGRDEAWPWPEPRLRYGNGSLAEVLIFAGSVLGDEAITERGLRMLDFLLEVEVSSDHLSVTGSSGRARGETGPLFDQQAIEIAAIADAAARAFDVTGDERWLDGVGLSWEWFLGRNDAGVAMYDPDTGAGFDGLEPDGRNENRGAESTLAALSTYQQARRLGRL